MAHLINGDDSLSEDIEVTALKTWELYQKITDLLCYPQYKPHKQRLYRDTPQYLFCLVGHQMATDQTAEISVSRYFEQVFEYEIQNRKKLAEAPTDKLILLFRTHRLPSEHLTVAKDTASTESTGISLWQIVVNAGKSHSGETVQYRRWKTSEFIALCQYLSDVLRTANRHYGEIFRMGLYPPDWMETINVSQARKINQLIRPKRELGHDNPAWLAESRKIWEKQPIKQLAGEKLASFDDFLATEIGRCLAGNTQAKSVVIGDYDFSQLSQEDEESSYEDSYSVDYDVAYDAENRLIKLQQQLDNDNDIDKTDKKLILQIIHQEDLTLDNLAVRKRYTKLNLDEADYIDYLGELIQNLLAD